LRHAPGLSLKASLEPPPQQAVFTDGDGLRALNRYDGRREPLAYLGDLASARPNHLLRGPKVLVLDGFGYPLDDRGVEQLWSQYDQGIQYVNESQNWSVVGTVAARGCGLDESAPLRLLAHMAFGSDPVAPATRSAPGPQGAAMPMCALPDPWSAFSPNPGSSSPTGYSPGYASLRRTA
jgi:hypothetical protein